MSGSQLMLKNMTHFTTSVYLTWLLPQKDSNRLGRPRLVWL